MPDGLHSRKSELIDRVADLVQTRLPRDKQDTATAFARLFYRHVPPEDVAERAPRDLYGAMLSMLQFAQQRPIGLPGVRVFNPTYDAHGWHTSHTVVEIVNDDMPFLVDSVTAALNGLGLTVHLVIHPMALVARDAAGRLQAIDDPETTESDSAHGRESLMHVEVDEQTGADTLSRIESAILETLRNVRVAVEDWRPMCQQMASTIADLQEGRERLPDRCAGAELEEAVAFLSWLLDNHFTFLGYRYYRLVEESGLLEMQIDTESGLGILRDTSVPLFEGLRRNFVSLPEPVKAFIAQPTVLSVAKSTVRAPVHRSVPMDVIILKTFNESGQVTGERAYAGLFTSVAYNRTTREIPFLRRKLQAVLDRAGFSPDGHDGKALTNILDTYPRDELFQTPEDELLTIALGILHLQERQRTALFVRTDPLQRFVTCLVFVPRDRYDTALRRKYEAILEAAYGGSCTTFYTQVTEGVLARVQFVIRTTPGAIPEQDSKGVEAKLVEATRGWSDHLQTVLIESKGEEQGLRLFRRYRDAFGAFYCENVPPQAAIFDIDRMEEVAAGAASMPPPIRLNLYRPIEKQPHEVHFKLYHPDRPVPLSDVLPMLEHMGLKVISEKPFEVDRLESPAPIWIHDFDMESAAGSAIDLARIKEPFQEAFARVWYGDMEDDGFNRLVLVAGLKWRQIVLVRALAKFLRQAQFPFSEDLIEDTLSAHPKITGLIVALFEAKFDPERGQTDADREQACADWTEALEAALDQVENLNEDTILRRFANLVAAALRTNFYQVEADGAPKPYLSLKFDSGRIDQLPLPRPWREIFVYSPRMEGTHLRGGPVARGGIRWSDRREDFRTEILGLMKAQMVKNAVIVPVGSKGGFVLKRPPKQGGREALQAEGIACYRTLMQGMLDITDNMVAGALTHPPRVVRHDGDDPYLVVAADKGTATFSDIANGISQEYGFWLDDAFASGGSAGYDHKKMGITARGAWESVKRHFRELGLDTQTQDFTVVGVGDMSGDVFGNGMLLSEHIRLIAAFNHLHIFIDPTPEAGPSFQERRRLFEQGRGSWDQYNPAMISEGGGVFARSAKSISLTPQIQKAIGTTRNTVTPTELISILLKAPIDLLWFGGIGTYAKASHETHADAGDKANDALRVNGGEIRARVIGEGANLGMTQFARIEFARQGGPEGAGGRVNTDFIDNAAGVDCSDHEVNIKILLGDVVAQGDMTLKQRNQLLEGMTPEVSRLVLRDNYLQTQALSMMAIERTELLDQQARFMKSLEKAGRLNRDIEMLPNDEELTERLGRRDGLTRPEQAVLLSYAKVTLYDDLLASGLPDDPFLAEDLTRYFPTALQDRHGEAIGRHALRREIIATYVTNSLVNRVGPTFVAEMIDKTGMGPAEIARAYLIVRDSFALRDLWARIETLDNQVPAEVQLRMVIAIRKMVERTTAWVLRYDGARLDLSERIGHYRPGAEMLSRDLDDLVYDRARDVIAQRVADLSGDGVPEDLAFTIAAMNLIASALDLIRISDLTGRTAREVAPVYFEMGNRLGIAWLRDSALRIQSASHWQKQAVLAIIDDLYALQTDLTLSAFDLARQTGDAGNGAPADGSAAMAETDVIAAWLERRSPAVERNDQLMAELRALDHLDLSMLAVATRRLRGLAAA